MRLKVFFSFIIFSFSILSGTIIDVPVDQPTIQSGINTAVNGDTVLVATGTYLENIDFDGKNIVVGSLFLTTQDTTYISQTVIDGNNVTNVVVFENGEGLTAILSGFTITNGNAAYGGGIYCYSSDPSLSNLIITGNFADYGGGIHCVSFSNPTINNIQISGNTATVDGGGIRCTQSSNPNLTRVSVTGNSAAFGGGVYCGTDVYPNLTNLTISGNSVTDNGGGIYCHSAYPNLVNSIISDNTGNYGIYVNEGGNPAISYSDIYNNENGNFYDCDPALGINVTTNANGDSCDIYYNIQMAPMFVDPGNEDYHLTVDSPCIDAGDPTTPTDPDTTIADMGAYYFDQFHNYQGSVWHISTTGSDITGNGSEDYPFATIQHGINSASTSDTILVRSGTYPENIDYSGKNIIIGSLFLTTQDTTYISQTIIDGNQNGRVVYFSNGEDSTAVLTGFTITNGSSYSGAGIYCYNSSPSLSSLSITENNANHGGGGLYCRHYASPNLTDVIFTVNSASNGGGIHCFSNSNPELSNVMIDNNSASSGGGLYCDSSCSPNLTNVTISENSATSGGGIYCSISSSPNLMKVEITGNSASYYGGGICCSQFSDPNMTNVTISGNSGIVSGGGIYCSYLSDPVLTNSIVSNNTGNYGIYNDSGDPAITYSNFFNNENGNFYGCDPAIGDNVTSNANGDTCDVYYNIQLDPLFADPVNADYHLTASSPCIDAGDPSSPLDPDTTVADMGAYFYDHNSISTPGNIEIQIVSGSVQISWDSVSGAVSYSVYSDTDPYGNFSTTEWNGSNTSWSEPIPGNKTFYRVTASN